MTEPADELQNLSIPGRASDVATGRSSIGESGGRWMKDAMSACCADLHAVDIRQTDCMGDGNGGQWWWWQ